MSREEREIEDRADELEEQGDEMEEGDGRRRVRVISSSMSRSMYMLRALAPAAASWTRASSRPSGDPQRTATIGSSG